MASIASRAVLTAGIFFTAVAHTLTGLIVAAVIWSAGDLLVLGRTQSVVAELAPEGARGHYLAAYGTSWGTTRRRRSAGRHPTP